MTRETFIYGLNGCAVTYHNGQKLYEHDDLIKCFEDLGIFEQDSKSVKVIKMREPTPEERESIDKYIKSISKPTVVSFWDLEQESCEDVANRILKRMWNCRGTKTTNIDKVRMEQIIREELFSTDGALGRRF